MEKHQRQGICNLVVVSDLHIGCRLGLCPPVSINLDDGGTYHASRLQKIVWKWWDEFWLDFVPVATRGEPFAVAINGDAVDGGAHHGNTTHITDNRDDQERLAIKILTPVIRLCDGRYYHIRGTEAHAGKSGVDEERLARQLGAIPDKDGRYARWELWFRLGGGLVHLMHHIGTTGSRHYEATAIHKELVESYTEAAMQNEEIPDVIIRSHRHRNIETRLQTYKGFGTACVTAGWQLKTPFAYKVAGARQATPQFGGTVVRWGDEDIFTRHFTRNISRPKVEALCLKTK